MLEKNHTILQIAGIVLLSFTGTLAVGQDTGNPGSNASAGGSAASSVGATKGSYYYDMNWHRTIKLGTAPFFNVELAKKAMVAYSFDAGAISDARVREKAEELYKSGKFMPAGIGEDGSYWMPARSSADEQSLEDAIKVLEAKGYPDVVYLGQEEEFLVGSEKIEGKAVVSWEPTSWGKSTPPSGPRTGMVE